MSEQTGRIITKTGGDRFDEKNSCKHMSENVFMVIGDGMGDG